MQKEPSDEFQTEDDFNEDSAEKAEYQTNLRPQSAEETARKSGSAMSAVMNLVISILVFLGIGWALDRWLNTAPWLLLAGVLFGSIVGFYQLLRLTSKLND